MEKIKSFIDTVISEVKKVDFPNSETTKITTIAVLSMAFIMAAIIGLIDFILSRVFKLIF